MLELEEKAKVINMMHDKDMRNIMTILLEDINSPRLIDSLECLRLIADIIRFILTLFVHEETADYRLLAVILESS